MKERIELLYGRALKEEIRKPGDVSVFGSNGKVGSHNVRWLDGPGVLVGRKGTVGAVHYTEGAFWPIDTVYYVKPVNDDDLRYVYYLLDYLPLKILNAATGVPGLSRRDAYALLGAFPPPDEQATIARILGAVDHTIECTKRAYDKAVALRVNVISVLLSRGTRGEPQRRSEAGMIPASWSCERLGKYIVEGPTNGIYRPESDYGSIGAPIVRIDSFDDGEIHGISTLRRVHVDQRFIPRYQLREHDLLINRVNSLSHIGKAAIVPALNEATLFESNMMKLSCGNGLRPSFLAVLLCSDVAKRHWLSRAKPAVNQASINQRDVRELPVPIPSEDDEQQVVVEVVTRAHEQREMLRKKLLAQNELKRCLMHDLLTGMVRVDSALFKNAIAS